MTFVKGWLLGRRGGPGRSFCFRFHEKWGANPEFERILVRSSSLPIGRAFLEDAIAKADAAFIGEERGVHAPLLVLEVEGAEGDVLGDAQI